LVVEAIAELRRKTAQECEPAGEPCTIPEVAHTAVSPKLAALIQALNVTMTEEFGLGGFAFAMVANDGLIAAHNATTGFVMPLVAPHPPASN